MTGLDFGLLCERPAVGGFIFPTYQQILHLKHAQSKAYENLLLYVGPLFESSQDFTGRLHIAKLCQDSGLQAGDQRFQAALADTLSHFNAALGSRQRFAHPASQVEQVGLGEIGPGRTHQYPCLQANLAILAGVFQTACDLPHIDAVF